MTEQKRVKKVCYVCGCTLQDYPYDPEHLVPNPEVICPSCGIHYGCDDEGAGDVIPDELAYSGWKFADENHKKIMKFWRQYWIDGGMKWWAEEDPFGRQPEGWDPKKQLENVPTEFK
ncbi:MAG: hypothetical protein RL141_130 [Candidatus Parcubacteria bacterium]|jgi:hypothetical protein